MSNLYSTKQKIAIANSVIEHACGNKTSLGYNDPIFTKLHKIEKKHLKAKSYDLSDFAICLSELPEKHFKLMLAIGWISYETDEPRKYLDGFYSEAYGTNRGITQIKHYITIDAYIDLLFIELHMIDLYSNAKAS
ncbi:MAG: hypothetical protein K0R94_3 [Burkholderiales bacterium]|jgi:hypothetical protein|nr:hypothetical protein [Burkholderiales bacterium]